MEIDNAIFEKMGAIKIGEEESAFSRLAGIFKATTEIEEQSLEKFRDLFGESTDEVVYCYKRDLSTFL